MEDSVITIVAIFLAAILMFIFPLVTVSDGLDDMTKLTLQTETTSFVDNVRKKGSLTLDEYNEYLHTATSGGLTPIDVEVEIQILDENPNIRENNSDKTKIGKNLYYNIYTSQIEERLGRDGKINLKEGDIICVKAKNTNKTLGQVFRSVFYKFSDDTYKIAASDSGMILTDGNI